MSVEPAIPPMPFFSLKTIPSMAFAGQALAIAPLSFHTFQILGETTSIGQVFRRRAQDLEHRPSRFIHIDGLLSLTVLPAFISASMLTWVGMILGGLLGSVMVRRIHRPARVRPARLVNFILISALIGGMPGLLLERYSQAPPIEPTRINLPAETLTANEVRFAILNLLHRQADYADDIRSLRLPADFPLTRDDLNHGVASLKIFIKTAKIVFDKDGFTPWIIDPTIHQVTVQPMMFETLINDADQIILREVTTLTPSHRKRRAALLQSDRIMAQHLESFVNRSQRADLTKKVDSTHFINEVIFGDHYDRKGVQGDKVLQSEAWDYLWTSLALKEEASTIELEVLAGRARASGKSLNQSLEEGLRKFAPAGVSIDDYVDQILTVPTSVSPLAIVLATEYSLTQHDQDRQISQALEDTLGQLHELGLAIFLTRIKFDPHFSAQTYQKWNNDKLKAWINWLESHRPQSLPGVSPQSRRAPPTRSTLNQRLTTAA